jgi:glyoxylase-like metal-dependent hydrolase (beta-lactamase superfamily II)
MRIVTFNQNEADVNTYVLVEKGSALVIDPGFNGSSLMDYLALNALKLEGILLTHGHFDHIRDIKMFENLDSIPIYIHEEDYPFLYDDRLNYAPFFQSSFRLKKTAQVIKLIDRQSLVFKDHEIQLYHTPGHTAGSSIYQWKNHLFTGDTLFCLGVGRTDLATGSKRQLDSSLLWIMNHYSNQDIIHPGHDKASTIGDERAMNPYVKILKK